MTQPTYFVMAFAGDPTTTNFLAFEVAEQLLTAGDDNNKWIVPEPAWTLTDFATQCLNDPLTEGAFVLFDVESISGTSSYLVGQTGFTGLYTRAAYVSCDRPTSLLTSPPPTGFSSSITTIASQTSYSGVPSSPKPNPEISPAPGTMQTTTNDQNPPSGKPYSTQTMTSSPAPIQTVTLTQTTNWIPTLSVRWMNQSELYGHKGETVIPFLTFAALGAYLAARNESVTNSTSETLPTTPGTTTNSGQIQISHQTTDNNSTLPYGIALLGTSLTSLSSGSVGGINQPPLLKEAAHRLAADVLAQLISCPACKDAIQSAAVSSSIVSYGDMRARGTAWLVGTADGNTQVVINLVMAGDSPDYAATMIAGSCVKPDVSHVVPLNETKYGTSSTIVPISLTQLQGTGYSIHLILSTSKSRADGACGEIPLNHGANAAGSS